jgi:hypothetical protein
VAEVTPIRRNPRFVRVVGGLIGGKILRHLGTWQTLRHDTGRLGGIGHAASTSYPKQHKGRLAQV